MADYQILYWKNLPAQIKVFEPGKRPIARELSARFQEAIDRLAMKEGLHGTDDYLDQWQWSERQTLPGTAEEVTDQLIAQLDAQYPE